MNDRKIIYILIAVNIFLALMIHKQRAYLVHLNRRQMKDIKELGETFKEEMALLRQDNDEHKFKIAQLKQLALRYNKNLVFYRTKQDPESIKDNYISNDPVNLNNNAGADVELVVGHPVNDVFVARSLISFNDLASAIPSNAKILSAILYLKLVPEKFNNVSVYHSIQLYPLRKNWEEGIHKGDIATTGESNWYEAKVGESKWKVEGIFPNFRDIKADPLISMVNLVRDNTNFWMELNFNTQGVEALQKLVKNKQSLNYGWLMKLENENRNKSSFTFYSGDTDLPEDRPYMEVIYTLNP